MNPKISIIIPIYNAENYIKRCAVSLFEQTFTSLEFVFVDDCSTDLSLEILRDLIKAYPQRRKSIKIIEHSENLGVASARNTGLLNAIGEYVGWVDADDWIALDMFQSLYEHSIAKKPDLVWCNFFKVFPEHKVEISQRIAQDKISFIKALILGTIQGMLWNKIIKRQLIVDNNLCFLSGDDLGEDRTFLIKVLFYSLSICYVNKSMYFYVNDYNVSITRDPKVSRIYEEINNAKEIERFLLANDVEFVSANDLNNFKFYSKINLLYTTSLSAIRDWANIFPETNSKLWNSNLKYKHKLLAYCSLKRYYFPIKYWCKLKILFNK